MPGSIGDSSLTEVRQVRTKLPKLQLNKFNDDPKVWNEWWIVTSANVHISDVEKFNSSRSYSKGEAVSADADLRLTSAKYEVGLGSLKKRFAQKQTIIIAHMDALFKLESCHRCKQSQKGL